MRLALAAALLASQGVVSLTGLGLPRGVRRGVSLSAKGSSGEAKGFGGHRQAPAQAPDAAATAAAVQVEAAPGVGVGGGAPARTTTVSGAGAASDADIDAIFKKYGIQDEGQSKARAEAKAEAEKRAARGEEAPFGESVIAKLDAKTQLQFDKILITGVSLSLGFVILCGIGISAGALHVVFPDITIPQSVDDAITKVLTPSFTPALGVFFFFSITFGLFKFAQISSSQTVYREP